MNEMQIFFSLVAAGIALAIWEWQSNRREEQAKERQAELLKEQNQSLKAALWRRE